MKLLVTGGAGYIGSVTVSKLIERGHEVVVYDNLGLGHRDAVAPGAELVIDELANGERLESVLNKYRIEAVIHFAAYCLVGESVVHPAKYFLNNLVNGIRLLEAMRKVGTRLIVFSSSAAVYGMPGRVPIVEEEPAKPINPYGESKLYFEKILSDYHSAYGLDCISLRYFNAAGATRDYGEDHNPETHLIPLVLRAAMGKTPVVKIFGDDYETRDGTCVRDFIHIEDLAEAHILALGWRGEGVYNLGNGKGFSVRRVIEIAKEVTGRKIKVERAARRAGDPPRLVASSQKIQKELGWKPKKPEISRIVESAWLWMKKHPDGYNK